MTEQRNLRAAMLKGMRLRCPNCGQGRLFAGYLKVAPACSECGLDFTPQRADDGPAYIVILLVCHIAGLGLHFLYKPLLDNPLALALILSAGALVLALALLPPVKGAIVAIQWAKQMHGFGTKQA